MHLGAFVALIVVIFAYHYIMLNEIHIVKSAVIVWFFE